MRTVLIVGAGGSRAQAASYRPQHTFGHPPLDGDFFDKTTQLAKVRPVVARRVRDLRAALGRNPAFYDPWGRASVTMEQFFADIYYAVAATSTAPPEALSAFIETVRLYVQVLAETTNWVSDLRRQGDLDRLIRHELRQASPLTVITFNHDLIIESVAAKLPSRPGQWCLRSLYGGVGLTNLQWPTGRLLPLHDADCRDQAPFTLLKLHGSVNWFMRSQSVTPPVSTLFPTSGQQRTIFVSNRGDVAIDTRLRRRAVGRGRPTWYTWPLVVTPIYDKQRITGMGLLQEVWDQANAAIMEAERLVLFGYSLPDADVLSKQLLRTAVRRNPSLNCIDCVNPDAQVVSKLRQLLDSPVIRLYRDASSYLTYSGTPVPAATPA